MNKSAVAVMTALLVGVFFAASLPTGARQAPSAPPFIVELTATSGGRSPGSALRANHIVYDATRDVIYASIADNQGPLGNSVVAVFRNGSRGQPLFVGSEPNVMAISDNDRYLYVGIDGVGAVSRVDLATMTLDGPPWSLGVEPLRGIRVAADMVVLADDSHAVAVARNASGRPPHVGVAIYDNGVMRPDVTQSHIGSDVIEPSGDPAQLFGYNRETAEGGLRTLAVDASGVTETNVYPGIMSGHSDDIRYAAERIFGTQGQVVDAVTIEQIGRFAVENNSLPVIQGEWVFFVTYNTSLLRYELHVFDLETLEFRGAATINALDSDNGPPAKMEFIDAGLGSMGIRTGAGDVFWLSYRFFEYASYLPAVAYSRSQRARAPIRVVPPRERMSYANR